MREKNLLKCVRNEKLKKNRKIDLHAIYLLSCLRSGLFSYFAYKKDEYVV